MFLLVKSDLDCSIELFAVPTALPISGVTEKVSLESSIINFVVCRSWSCTNCWLYAITFNCEEFLESDEVLSFNLSCSFDINK